MTVPAADTGWVPGFAERFTLWWPTAEPLLVAHQYAEAFRTYPWPTFETSPWTPAQKPLAETRLALVTTAGLYRTGVDAPFASDSPGGDPSWRSIPDDVPPGELEIAHAHFSHAVAREDPNTIFPLERCRELVAEGRLGALAPSHASVMGYTVRADTLATTTAPEIAERFRRDGVDAALVVPV